MAKLNTFTCDKCKTVKREVNHWWMLSIAYSPFSITIIAWTKDKETDDSYSHLCGTEHLQQFIAEKIQFYLSKINNSEINANYEQALADQRN